MTRLHMAALVSAFTELWAIQREAEGQLKDYGDAFTSKAAYIWQGVGITGAIVFSVFPDWRWFAWILIGLCVVWFGSA